MTFTEVAEGTLVVWTSTFQVRFPFGATLTRVLAKPVVTHVFGAILDAADTALSARQSR